jgi:tetratricopeptide (TPR) repeat protein
MPLRANSFSMRAVLVCLLLATVTVHAEPKAKKDKPEQVEKKPEQKPPEPKPPRTPGPDDAKANEILKRIETGPDRKAAIDELVAIAPHAVEALGEWLARPHATDMDTRRAALVLIDAAVPDKNGKFPERKRQSAKEMKADDEIDWQAKLLELDPATPGVGEVIADVAAIRALSATKDIRAAQLIFDAAFLPETMIYRDECGRYVRKMEPYSIPAITKESQGRQDRRRYATWQLERLDRQDPIKALSAAKGNEELQIAILEVFRTTKLREAVHAVWTKVNDDAPRVRAAARATWMDYIVGPAPPPAPKAKLKLPGGKLTKKPKPLWLTYRELADNELRMAANELLHEDYPIEDETRLDDKETNVKVVKIDLQEVTKRLFEYYDGERGKQEREQWTAAKTKADAGDLAGATAMVDRLIATNPDRAERAEMSKLYVAWAKQLESKQQWSEASAAYSKAHGLDPQGSKAGDILAAHHYALGKSLEAQGKDGGPDFRKAQQLKPDFTPAVIAASRAESGGKPTWMLFAAALAAAAAAALFAVAMLRRRGA